MNADKYRSMNEFLLLSMFYLFCCIETEDKLIYILLWDAVPVFENRLERKYFINNKCSFQNCFVTDNKSFFSDITKFDVILFNSVQVSINKRELIFPHTRSAYQKYIFMSSEPVSIYPITTHFNDFFNYTFTYKLDSDFTWRFFIVRNKTSNTVVAPRRKVKWIDINDMQPVSEELKIKLQTKNKAAAWFVSHCPTLSKREEFVTKLKIELQIYNLSIDTIGLCAEPNASPCNHWHEGCHRWIETNHYFYLAFENSMCEDYVTEKILTATNHFAIPIVFGGADYSRFLPKGSYIYANDLDPEELASTMNDVIHNKSKYYEFFKWHQYYSIHDHKESSDTDEICGLCGDLNDKQYDFKTSVYTHMTWFWKD